MSRPSSRLAEPAALALIEQEQMQAVGYLLIRCGQLWNQMAIGRVNASADGVKLRQAHTRLFPLLTNRDGIRITDLARRLEVSKQAIQPLIAELEEAGVVSVRVDQTDARALRVHLTEAGAAAFAAGNGILAAIERELEDVVGSVRLERLRRDLGALLMVLTRRSEARPPETTHAEAGPRQTTPKAASGAADGHVRRRK